MVRTTEIGSQSIISFQTKYPVFTALDLDNTMTELNFSQTPSQQQTGQPQKILYGKENMYVDFDQNNVLNFRFLNTVNISNSYDVVKNTLTKLKINPESINLMGFSCKTMAHEVGGHPEHLLTSLLSNEAQTRIKNALDIEPGITSLVISNSDPQNEDLQIRLEPLASNPTDSFYIHINYRTSIHEKFNNFISDFGEDTIRSIVTSVCDDDAERN